MGLKDAFNMMRNLVKAMKPANELVAYLNEQQAQGVRLSPKLRNAIAMHQREKDNPTESDPKEFLSFSDTCWYYMDIRDELQANPGLLTGDLAEAFNTYKACVDAAQEAGERNFEKSLPKWEKKHHCAYQPKPRVNLIGEPLE